MLQVQRSIVHHTDRAASGRQGVTLAKMLVPLIPASLTQATPNALLGTFHETIGRRKRRSNLRLGPQEFSINL